MDTLEAPKLPDAHHPSTESLTLELFAWVGPVGGWRGGFFFQAVFGVESGQAMQVLFGPGGRIYFPFNQWEGPRCLAFIPFKFGGQEGFFFHFSLFPNVLSRCSSKFLMGSQYVPQVHNAFLNMFCI
jgi:hypothetical protein